MENNLKIVVTGAAGFIGSCLAGYLNSQGFNDLILVDDFSHTDKDSNFAGKKILSKIDREEFLKKLEERDFKVDFIFHLGARTDTTEFDYAIHEKLNVSYSKSVWEYCAKNKIPLVYASSAATYGKGENGYIDDENIIDQLRPLNPYGVSKNEFDKWAIHQKEMPLSWAGLKFFNVYGPNEYHKARMASVIFHAYNQIRQNGFVKLFKSHEKEYKDGEQLRDFIYVKDVIKICFWFMKTWLAKSEFKSGIYNVGTGEARTFNDLVKATFSGLDLPKKIEYIDMPKDIMNSYQNFTEAEMDKLKSAGYTDSFYSLEAGVDDYVRNYLSNHTYY
ncbi:MAG: ADP-glyceromanno-heptose 6-epimerase [Ginsengibacter sp.]